MEQMSDLISRQAAIDICANAIDLWHGQLGVGALIAVRDKIKELPPAQPEPCEDDPRADVYYLAEKIGIHQLYALVVQLRGEPEPCEDAVSRKAVIDAIDEWKEACADSGHKETVSDIMLIRKDFIGLPPVTPKQRTDTLKAEIRRMKRSFTICINSDYYTGYMSALSAVEGYIAKWEGDAE